MKHRLHEIDLARIAHLPRDEKRARLEAIGKPIIKVTYAPVRSCFHDLLNVEPEMFGDAPRTSWEVIKKAIAKKAKNELSEKCNTAVAAALYKFVNAKNIKSRELDFSRLTFSNGVSVGYWLPYVMIVDGTPVVLFIDPRRSYRLGPEARRFAFSMMHERIRASDPDFESVSLGIIQFSQTDTGSRRAQMHLDSGITLYRYDELESMIRETYEIWWQILAERETANRKKSGTSGGMLF